jgi:sugar (pentulose or hexulose) kinase
MKASAADSAFLGIDFGTSGARCCVINKSGVSLCSTKAAYTSSEPNQLASAWETALFELIDSIPTDIKGTITCLAIDGTSSTTLLIDAATGELLQPPKMYNEAQEPHIVDIVKTMAPLGHTVTASTSTLAKVVTWHEAGIWQAAAAQGKTPLVLHQSDWLASRLHGYDTGVTDWNNCLKLGFDPGNCEYPDFIVDQDFASILPPVVCAPGTPLAPITPAIAKKTGLSNECVVCAGTTDSIAATLAAGISEPGQAVTSLGSTLAIKLFSETRADDAAYGVYSHRIGDVWLVGGASNTGGAVLRKYFTDAELKALTPKMDARSSTGLKYTVLLKKGERFPLNDPEMEPCLEPRPSDDAVFLQGMLEAMAATEAAAYRKLTELGASPVKEILTAGGGAANPVWTELRSKAIGAPVKAAVNGEAAYGAAILARQGYELMEMEKSPLLL